MQKMFLRTFWWLLGLFAFFGVFAFALNNRAEVQLHWFFGYEAKIQLILLVFISFIAGVCSTLIAMLPLWWRQYKKARALEIEVASSFSLLDGPEVSAQVPKAKQPSSKAAAPSSPTRESVDAI